MLGVRWHGVELCRGSVLGGLTAPEAGVHLAVLCVYIAAGWVLSRRAFRRRLAT